MQPPYYAVIFTSVRAAGNAEAYDGMSRAMSEIAAKQPGYLGIDSVRDPDGRGITVSYWKDEESILAWREQADHAVARKMGREEFYKGFRVRVCRVERDYAS